METQIGISRIKWQRFLEDTAAIQAKHNAGERDWHIQQEKLEINHIIGEAANSEDPVVVEKKHKMQADTAATNAKTFAVDAPDGESDGPVQEELYEI
jgi:hypothetical protein